MCVCVQESDRLAWAREDRNRNLTTEVEAVGETRAQMLLELHHLPFSHSITPLTPVCPSKPASSLPRADELWQQAWLLSSCQDSIIAQERTASSCVCKTSISKWHVDMKNMPVMPSRQSGWQEIKETDTKPRPVAPFHSTVSIKASELRTTCYYLLFILGNKVDYTTFLVLQP